MNYYLLTDELRKGFVISEDGRKHFRFVFGRFGWERTTLFQAYLTEGTPEFGKYKTLSEEAAMEALSQFGKALHRWKEQALHYAQEALSGLTDRKGRPSIDHARGIAENLEDWDEEIVALLAEGCKVTGDGGRELGRKGYPLYLCAAVELLQKKEENSFSEYLKKLRMNRIARNVKLMELSYQMSVLEQEKGDPSLLQAYRHGRQFLYGDISQLHGEVDQRDFFPGGQRILSSETIFKSVYAKAMGGRKIPHGLSNPVLRYVDGKLAVAFFVYTYSKADLENKMIGRPCTWIVADLAEGKDLRAISCSVEDFSGAPKDGRYSMDNPKGGKDKDFFSKAYSILDSVRNQYIKTGVLSEEEYETYLDMILETVPPEYHCFYRELSL